MPPRQVDSSPDNPGFQADGATQAVPPPPLTASQNVVPELALVSPAVSLPQPPDSLPASAINAPIAAAAMTGGTRESGAAPVYPREVFPYRLQGEVVLKATITIDGSVADLKVLRGHPSFVAAALDAVRQWKYKPFLRDGRPVQAETTITLEFLPPGIEPGELPKNSPEKLRR
ncbi:MAG: energy transducer TonB [Acidobacteriales bacterium]|nr:energy transducer TonB [Terriglobales bacterium]